MTTEPRQQQQDMSCLDSSGHYLKSYVAHGLEHVELGDSLKRFDAVVVQY